MTKSENVTKIINDLDLNSTKANQNEKFLGVATRKQVRDDCKKVTVIIEVLYDLIKIYGYNDKKTKFQKMGTAYHSLHLEEKQKHADRTVKDKLKLRNRYLQFVLSNGIGSWKDLFKYKINAYFSWVMEQEIPPAPKGIENFPDLKDPSFLFYGRGKRFIRNMKVCNKQFSKYDRERLESFAQSVAQSKKGAPPVSSEMVREAEIKCWKHLTTEREDIPSFTCDDWEKTEVNRDTMKFQLRRTVREIFRGKVPTWDELTKPFVPSTSSQYNFSRTGLGGIGAFHDIDDIKLLRCHNWGFQGDKKTTFISKSIGPVNLKEELTTLYGKAGIVDQERIDRDFENVMVKGTIGLHFDGKELCELWNNLIYPIMINEALTEPPRTIVIGLPEPLKVRCITAGPPVTYAVLKPMQKWLWRNLKDLDVFQLIGTPVTTNIVKSQLGRINFFEEFISGDYKASTDNLHSWVSECLLEELGIMWKEQRNQFYSTCKDGEKPENLFLYKEIDETKSTIEDFLTLMKRALTGHMILNPKFNDEYQKNGGSNLNDADFLPQKEGQLMGSIISFPFLCLANAAMCRWAMEISDQEIYSLLNRPKKGQKKIRLLINGDDCVFPGRIGMMFGVWQKVTAFGGLESSVGKTFQSRKFLTINSVQYKYTEASYDWEAEVSSFEEDYYYDDIKYVNLGLVYGQKKDGIRGKPFYRVGAIHRDLHKTCPPECLEIADKLFLREARKVQFKRVFNPITKKCDTIEDQFGSILNARVPYYMPEWLGGLGLVKTKDDQINEWDLKVASTIRSNTHDNDFKIRTLKLESMWQFHRLVDESLADYAFLDDQPFKKVEFLETERDLSEEYQKLYTLQVVDILLNKSLMELTGMDKDLDEDLILRKAYYQNEKIWRNLRNHPKFGGLVAAHEPADYQDLLQERKEFNLSCFDIRY